MKLNKGDFGGVTAENGGTKFYFRCRSFVDIQTGKVLAERKQQCVLLGTQDASLFRNLKSGALYVKADEIRRRIMAWEEAAINGQPIAADGSVPAPEPEPEANGDITITEFYEKVFLPKKETLTKTGQLAAATLETYKNYWRMFLKAHFNGTQTFKNYTSQKALRYLENLKKEDGAQYGENTVRKIRAVGVAIFKEAIKRGYLDNNVPPKHNPWKDVTVTELPTTAAEKGIAYTENEVISIIKNLDAELGDTSKPLVEARDANIRAAQIALALCFWAGTRPSEAQALDWSNVDVAAGTITVKESIVNGVHAARTKTGDRNRDGSRVVTYLAPLGPILREWHKRNGSPKSGLVIHKDGAPVSLRHLSDEVVKPNCLKYGLRWESWYPARRGCGTHLVDIGVSIEYGAEFLGNTIPVFEDHYLIKTGKGSAKAAEIDRQHRLAQAQQAEVAPAALIEQKRLRGELAALGIGEQGQ